MLHRRHVSYAPWLVGGCGWPSGFGALYPALCWEELSESLSSRLCSRKTSSGSQLDCGTWGFCNSGWRWSGSFFMVTPFFGYQITSPIRLHEKPIQMLCSALVSISHPILALQMENPSLSRRAVEHLVLVRVGYTSRCIHSLGTRMSWVRKIVNRMYRQRFMLAL